MNQFQSPKSSDEVYIKDYQSALMDTLGLYDRKLMICGIDLFYIEGELFNILEPYTDVLIDELSKTDYDFKQDDTRDQRILDMEYDKLIFQPN